MPLENLRSLEDAYQHGWVLSTSQISELLGVAGKTLAKKESFNRHGFTFTRASEKVGVEVGWMIGKVKPVPPAGKKK